jgi:hypothetical protein
MTNEERLWKAAGCESLFSALVNYGPLTVSELRWMNRETLSMWILDTLFALIDQDVDLHSDTVLVALASGNVIRVYPDGYVDDYRIFDLDAITFMIITKPT